MIWFVKGRRAQNVDDYETWVEGGVSPTLNAFDNGNDTRATVLIAASFKPGASADARSIGYEEEMAPTLEGGGGGNNKPAVLIFTAQRVGEPPRIYQDITPSLLSRMGTGGNNTPMIIDPLYSFDTQFGSNANVFEDQSPTLKASQQSPTVAFQPGTMVRLGGGVWEEIAPTLRAEAKRGDNEPHIARDEPLVFPSTFSNSSVSDDGISPTLTVGSAIGVPSPPAIAFTTEQTPKYNNDQALTLTQGSPSGGGQPQAVATNFDEYNFTGGNDIHHQIRAGTRQSTGVLQNAIVRRLTPTECERLMGWPDNHTLHRADGKTNSDSTRYKMCGNGVATPVAQWIATQLKEIL